MSVFWWLRASVQLVWDIRSFRWSTNEHFCIVMALNMRPHLLLILSCSWAWVSTGVSLVYPYTRSLTTGHHCCLWCKVTYEQMQCPRAVQGTSPGRSPQTLDHDLHKFLTTGMGNIKVAKSYNNVIRERLFDVPLDQVRKCCQQWFGCIVTTCYQCSTNHPNSFVCRFAHPDCT